MNDIHYKNIISNTIAIMLSIIPLIIFPFYLRIPFINFNIFDIFMLPKTIALYCFAIILIGLLVQKGNICSEITHGNRSLEDVLIFVYFILLVLSTIFSIDINKSILGETYYNEGLIMISVYIFQYLITKRYYIYSDKHIRVVMFSTFVISLWGIGQFLGFDPLLTELTGSVYVAFRNPNYFGAYLVLLAPIAIFSYIKTSLKRYYIIAGLLYLCLLSTNTRGSWLGFLVSLLVLSFYIVKLYYHPRRLISVILMLIIITIAFNIYNDNKFSNRFLSIFGDFKTATSQTMNYERVGAGRIFIWKRTLEIIKDNPILGTGIETFSTVFNERYLKESFEIFGRPQPFYKAHNEYLNIAQSSGIPSLLVYLIWLGSIIWAGIKAVPKRIEILPLLVSIIGYSVQAFFNVSVVGVAFIFWCFCGILMNYAKRPIDIKNHTLQLDAMDIQKNGIRILPHNSIR